MLVTVIRSARRKVAISLLIVLLLVLLFTRIKSYKIINRINRKSLFPRKFISYGSSTDTGTDTTTLTSPGVTPTAALIHPLSLPFDRLTQQIGGSGKAKLIWEKLRLGINPMEDEPPLVCHNSGNTINYSGNSNSLLSGKAKKQLQLLLGDRSLIPNKVVQETLSNCGTRKLLVELESDKKTIESVLIPSVKYDRTTLCVSTQIGCDRGCAFCATGKMGLVRNLTSDEIIGQVVRGLEISRKYKMPPMTNVVFMGMGDAGRNMDAVGEAVNCLTDRDRMSMAKAKITISSVGPSPEAFSTLAAMPGTLAWSLHSPDDKIRKVLVPSTKHTTVELRDGLLKALATREAIRTRTIMIALTLIDGINDSLEDAQKLVDFIKPMQEICPKIALDLIPYNDIDVYGFNRPSKEKVNAFQNHLRGEGLFCSVRVTRGDSESSACGMLATSRKPNKSSLDTSL